MRIFESDYEGTSFINCSVPSPGAGPGDCYHPPGFGLSLDIEMHAVIEYFLSRIDHLIAISLEDIKYMKESR